MIETAILRRTQVDGARVVLSIWVFNSWDGNWRCMIDVKNDIHVINVNQDTLCEFNKMIEYFRRAEVEYVFPICTSPWVICTSACVHHELKRDTVALAAGSIRCPKRHTSSSLLAA